MFRTMQLITLGIVVAVFLTMMASAFGSANSQTGCILIQVLSVLVSIGFFIPAYSSKSKFNKCLGAVQSGLANLADTGLFGKNAEAKRLREMLQEKISGYRLASSTYWLALANVAIVQIAVYWECHLGMGPGGEINFYFFAWFIEWILPLVIVAGSGVLVCRSITEGLMVSNWSLYALVELAQGTKPSSHFTVPSPDKVKALRHEWMKLAISFLVDRSDKWTREQFQKELAQ